MKRTKCLRIGASLLPIGTLFVGGTFSATAALAGEEKSQAFLLLEELKALKVQQEAIDSRIDAIEKAVTALAVAEGAALPEPQVTQAPTEADVLPAPRVVAQTQATPLPSSPEKTVGKLTVGGDLLMRFEGNYNDPITTDRERGVYRARLRAKYQATDGLAIGILAETGDPDDPNSGYGTFSGFADDISVSLSQAYIEYKKGDWALYAGKFPRPFISTDTLWDGDAYPQGLAVKYASRLGSGQLSANGILFIVDEDAGGADSQMLGGQVAYRSDPNAVLGVRGAVAYYDYELGSANGADAGDFRGNLLTHEGTYASDFDIIDVIAGVDYRGFGESWPLALTADYIHNEGAADDLNSAIAGYAFLGRKSAQGDVRFGYGYAEVENDAVLAAFSNDNLSLGTNYRA
ncbi:MAG: putative porin, partial [Pseudomonadota bacterium]